MGAIGGQLQLEKKCVVKNNDILVEQKQSFSYLWGEMGQNTYLVHEVLVNETVIFFHKNISVAYLELKDVVSLFYLDCVL